MDQPAASRVFSPVCELTKTPTLAGERADWICAGVILLIAAAIRIAFFSRGLGTDEIVYIAQAYRLLDGQVPHATYLGAIRYGINAFQALSIRLYGNGEAGAAGLFFACSLAGILLTYLFANYLWGRTSAIWSGWRSLSCRSMSRSPEASIPILTSACLSAHRWSYSILRKQGTAPDCISWPGF